MNKIFINDRPLYVSCDAVLLSSKFDSFSSYSTSNELKKLVSDFETDSSKSSMGILFESVRQMEAALFSIYKIIEAAGGIVSNEDGKILFIFRHGKWDLPKGKIETGENEKAAAIREVQEECGIKELSLGEKFTSTYHTYKLEGKNILKISHWYKMNYSGKSLILTPQTEEGITDAHWMNKAEIKEAMTNTFASIEEVMRLYLEEKK